MIYDDCPAARIARLYEALAPLADKLRHNGAAVEILDQGNRAAHTILMAVTMGGPRDRAKKLSDRLESLASKTGGLTHSCLLSPELASAPDGKHRFALAFTVHKRRAA